MAVDEAIAAQRGRMLLDAGYEAGMVFFNPNHDAHSGEFASGGGAGVAGGTSGRYEHGGGRAELNVDRQGRFGGYRMEHTRVTVTREGAGFHTRTERQGTKHTGLVVEERHHADAASVNAHLRGIGGKQAARFSPEHLAD